MYVWVCGTESGDDEELAPLSLHTGSKDRTQSLGLPAKHLYPISHLTLSFEAQVSQMCNLLFREVDMTAETVAF